MIFEKDLAVGQEEKDLGVIIRSDLKPTKQNKATNQKSNSITIHCKKLFLTNITHHVDSKTRQEDHIVSMQYSSGLQIINRRLRDSRS